MNDDIKDAAPSSTEQEFTFWRNIPLVKPEDPTRKAIREIREAHGLPCDPAPEPVSRPLTYEMIKEAMERVYKGDIPTVEEIQASRND